MEEIFERDGKLVSKKVWEAKISDLRSKVNEKPAFRSKERAIVALKRDLKFAVKKRLPEEKFGVMFSGGVDSSVIAFLCKDMGAKFTCYTAAFGNSKDYVASLQVSKQLGLRHKARVFSMKEISNIFSKTAPVLPDKNVVSLGVASVVYATVSMAKKDGVALLFSGLGSEEIFAGYQRHKLSYDVNEECWNGLVNMWGRDLIRDAAMASFLKVHFMTPLLDEDLVVSSMRIPGKLKVSGDQNKLVLREAALDIGIPKEIAFRKKIAAQYGSGFDAAMEKLAREKGLKFKSGLVDFY